MSYLTRWQHVPVRYRDFVLRNEQPVGKFGAAVSLPIFYDIHQAEGHHIEIDPQVSVDSLGVPRRSSEKAVANRLETSQVCRNPSKFCTRKGYLILVGREVLAAGS